MPYVIQPINEATDELWRAGLLFYSVSRNMPVPENTWIPDTSFHAPSMAPTKHYPEDYMYAIYLEE